MKRILFLLAIALFGFGCNGQNAEKTEESAEKINSMTKESPAGSWKVHKEFDEAGNLTRYDSIYSWSSSDEIENLGFLDRDSLLESVQSRFYRDFAQYDFEQEGIGDYFAEDSLFTKHFFNHDYFGSDFSKDFMDLDKMYERMEGRQKQFLEKYLGRIEQPEDGQNNDNL